MWHPSCISCRKPGDKNDKMTVLWLRQTEHIRGHLWHRYSITVNQVKVATVKLSTWWLQLNHYKPWFSSFRLSSSPLLKKKSLYEPQILEYRINWDIYELFHMQVLIESCYNRWKARNPQRFWFNRPLLPYSRCMSRYETVSLVSFISSSME